MYTWYVVIMLLFSGVTDNASRAHNYVPPKYKGWVFMETLKPLDLVKCNKSVANNDWSNLLYIFLS